MQNQTVLIALGQNDLQALAVLMDAGVKAMGLASVKQASSLLVKLEAAVAAANAKPEPEPQETE